MEGKAKVVFEFGPKKRSIRESSLSWILVRSPVCWVVQPMGVKKSSLLESPVLSGSPVYQEVQSVKESSLPVSPVCQGVYCLSRSSVCQEVQSVG
jgi:hypothetical protein